MRQDVLLWAAAVPVAFSVAGCGGSSSSGTNAPVLTPRSVSAPLSNGLTATLSEDRTAVPVGGIVNYTLTLTNPTTSPITYQPMLSGTFFSNEPAYLAVTDPAGKPAFPTGVTSLVAGTGPGITLAPGQSTSGTVAVGSPSLAGQGGYAAAGQYTATASFALFVGGTDMSSGTEINATTGPLTVTVQ